MPKGRPTPPTDTPDAGAAFAATTARNALSMMVRVVAGMDAGIVAASLQEMRRDPEHVINATNETGAPRWAHYEAGGPLYPEHVEIRLGTAAEGITDRDALVGLLRRYAEAPLSPVAPTKWNWLSWWRPPGLPPCAVGLIPFPGAGGGVAAIVAVGARSLREHPAAACQSARNRGSGAAFVLSWCSCAAWRTGCRNCPRQKTGWPAPNACRRARRRR